jgi:hypothetical protein
MSSPTNEIKARAKLLSMPFPYLVTLLILLPFVLFRKHSGLVRHNLCDVALVDRLNCAFRNALGDGLFCIGNRVYGVPHTPPAQTAPSMDQPKADLPRYRPSADLITGNSQQEPMLWRVIFTTLSATFRALPML